MKDRTLLLVALMLIGIGTSAIADAATGCKTGNAYSHTNGGCYLYADPFTGIPIPGTCGGCNQDFDTGGCGTPVTATQICTATPKPHTHKTYTYSGVTWVGGIPYASCTAGTPFNVTGQDGKNNGGTCKAKPKIASPIPINP